VPEADLESLRAAYEQEDWFERPDYVNDYVKALEAENAELRLTVNGGSQSWNAHMAEVEALRHALEEANTELAKWVNREPLETMAQLRDAEKENRRNRVYIDRLRSLLTEIAEMSPQVNERFDYQTAYDWRAGFRACQSLIRDRIQQEAGNKCYECDRLVESGKGEQHGRAGWVHFDCIDQEAGK
jgi:hypothetical protein